MAACNPGYPITWVQFRREWEIAMNARQLSDALPAASSRTLYLRILSSHTQTYI